MAEIIFVRPLPGKRVRLESPNAHVVLSEEGTRVRKSQYWIRAKGRGDVEIVEPAPTPAEE